MATAFSTYETSGPAEARAARGAALVDLSIGAVAGVLIWPFPVMRILFTDAAGGSAGGGWALHVPALLAFMAVMAWVCSGLLVLFAKRTLGMYVLDLGFRAHPAGAMAAFVAACPWTLAGLAGIVGAAGPAGRFADARLGSTRSA